MVEEREEKEPSIYIEGFLFKKEEKWVEFWIVLQDRYLMIHHKEPDYNKGIHDYLIGWIEITKQTKCIMGKKKSYSFPFYIQTSKGKYLFKTPSTLLRHQWVRAIELCAAGKSPDLIPKHLSQVDRSMENECDGQANEGYTYSDRNSSADECDSDETLCAYGDRVNGDRKEFGKVSEKCDLIVEEFEHLNEDTPANVILVSTGCENIQDFLWNSDGQDMSSSSCDEKEKSTIQKNVAFLPYEKPPNSTIIPSISISLHSPSTDNRLIKSAESIKRLDFLGALRTNSDTSIGGQQKRNCRYFSRHLNSSSLEDEETLDLV